MSSHGAPRAGDTGGVDPVGRGRTALVPVAIATAVVVVVGGLVTAARSGRTPSTEGSAATSSLPEWFRTAISETGSTTLPSTATTESGRGATPSPTPPPPTTGSPASSTASTTTTTSTTPPTTSPATITTVAPQLRGVSGELVDADELAALEAAAAPYVPPPIPNRQPLRAPTLERDTPDPHLVVDGGMFHVFSTNADGFNVPVRSSPDLAVWSEPVEAVPALPSWAVAGFTWAPTVALIGDRWVLAAAVWVAPRDRHCIVLFTSPAAVGPYTPASGPLVCDVEGAIDPYLFEHDGRAFLLWKQIGSPAGEIFVSELDRTSLALSWPTHLLASSNDWEGGVVENPAMIDTGSGLLLAYSANWWTDRRYAIGYAECETPTGPCHKVTTERPWLATGDGADGPGGQSFATDGGGQVWLGFHGWVGGVWSGGLDTTTGGERWFHAEPLAFADGRPILVNRPAEGRLEHWVRAPGGVIAGGWAGDVDHRRATVVEVSVDGVRAATIATSIARPDVAAARPDLGLERGFAERVPVPAGSHEVCAVAVDDLGATRTPMGCLTVIVDGAPFGVLTSATSPEAGAVEVRGWAIDPDVDGPAEVRVLVDGVDAGGGPAQLTDPAAAAAHPAYGAAHGFAWWVPVASGTRDVCVVVLDDAGGAEVALGCVAVPVAAPPTTPPTTSATTSTTSTIPPSTTSTTAPSTTSSLPPSTTSSTTTTSTTVPSPETADGG